MPDQSNQPTFDPLHCTKAEEDDMVAGFLDGTANRSLSRETLAYAWGRRNGINDRLGVVDDEQRHTVARMRREGVLG